MAALANQGSDGQVLTWLWPQRPREASLDFFPGMFGFLLLPSKWLSNSQVQSEGKDEGFLASDPLDVTNFPTESPPGLHS